MLRGDACLSHRKDAEHAEKDIFKFAVKRSRLNNRDGSSDFPTQEIPKEKRPVPPCAFAMILHNMPIVEMVSKPHLKPAALRASLKGSHSAVCRVFSSARTLDVRSGLRF